MSQQQRFRYIGQLLLGKFPGVLAAVDHEYSIDDFHLAAVVSTATVLLEVCWSERDVLLLYWP